MNIALIGAGFTGLSCSYRLLEQGHKVTIFEKDSFPGGLAVGFKAKEWTWSLEKHYHHWFTNDDFVLNLAKEINHEVIIKRPKTSVFVDNNIYQLDSATNLLKFPALPLFDKLRMGVTLATLRYNPFWMPLEKIKAAEILPKMMGKLPYKKIWEPLFISKFGKYANDVSLAWFGHVLKKEHRLFPIQKEGFWNLQTRLLRK
jgi:protoporphyrinogen oxidase